jgi:hypothetical protein
MLRIHSIGAGAQRRPRIGWPTKVCHFIYDTYDRFHGFSDVPAELQPEPAELQPEPAFVNAPNAKYSSFAHTRAPAAAQAVVILWQG